MCNARSNCRFRVEAFCGTAIHRYIHQHLHVSLKSRRAKTRNKTPFISMAKQHGIPKRRKKKEKGIGLAVNMTQYSKSLREEAVPGTFLFLSFLKTVVCVFINMSSLFPFLGWSIVYGSYMFLHFVFPAVEAASLALAAGRMFGARAALFGAEILNLPWRMDILVVALEISLPAKGEVVTCKVETFELAHLSDLPNDWIRRSVWYR